jgi:hypothetical protein
LFLTAGEAVISLICLGLFAMIGRAQSLANT